MELEFGETDCEAYEEDDEIADEVEQQSEESEGLNAGFSWARGRRKRKEKKKTS